MTNLSERIHDSSTNLSIKTIELANMRVANCNQLATNIVTIDKSLIIIMLELQINCFQLFCNLIYLSNILYH